MSTQSHSSAVVGCGSNVVDLFFRVKAIPKSGEKGYFANPNQTLETSLVGGVTLNHLAWAKTMGVPTALLALQGQDDVGKQIRNEMSRLGVSTEYVQVNDKYSSSVSYVWLTPDGERCILMAPGSTGDISTKDIDTFFSSAVKQACLLTTEISQVPLSAVKALLQMGRNTNVPTVLDVDVPPDVATTSANLGDIDTLYDCVKLADVMKPSLEAAQQLLHIFAKKSIDGLSINQIASLLREVFQCKLVAVTNGSNGSGLSIESSSIHVPVVPSQVVDATGAGDAYLGGMIAGLYHWGLPNHAQSLSRLGELASATGAACVRTLGALPNPLTSRKVVLDMLSTQVRDKLPTTLTSNSGNTSQKPLTSNTNRTNENQFKNVPFYQSIDADLRAVDALKHTNHHNMHEFVTRILNCTGRVFTTGIGKSGAVAARLSASLSSIGIGSEFVHASEWIHGDLGKLKADDLIIVLSLSGATPELVNVLPHWQQRGVILCAICCHDNTIIGKAAHSCIVSTFGDQQELLTKIPTRSVVVQETVCNALLTELTHRKNVNLQHFLFNHPGGAIGTTKKSN